MIDFALEWVALFMLSLFMNDLSGDSGLVSHEDTTLNFTELAIKYGQTCEEHDVITEDGYILKLFHIPGDKTRPVLLISGNMGSADEYIVRGDTSLAIALAKANYDVWGGNVRGCKYSRRHLTLDPDVDDGFWDFSFHEYGIYDMPAFIDYILTKTEQKQVNVIGFSIGTTVFYILGSERPEYNEKVKIKISLAPAAYLSHSVSVSAVSVFAPIINRFLLRTGQEELYSENSTTIRLIRRVCSTPLSAYVCLILFFFPICGYDSKGIEPDFAPIAIAHYPTSVSRKDLLHLSQVANSKRFPKFDYGVEENIARYGSESPPNYNLTAVTMKVALISGKNDLISTLPDVELLKAKLPNVVDHIILKPKRFNHIDFTWGKNNHKVLFPHIFELLESQHV